MRTVRQVQAVEPPGPVCECPSFTDCDLLLPITWEQYRELHSKGILISDKCTQVHGYELVERREGFSIYRSQI